MKHLVHEMKVVERVLEKGLCRIVSVNEMLFGFMHESRIINAVFTWRRVQEEYDARKKKLCICLLDVEKTFDRVQRKWLEWQ